MELRRPHCSLVVALIAGDLLLSAVRAIAAEPFIFEGLDKPRLADTVRKSANEARRRLESQWPGDLPEAPLRLIWIDDADAFETEAGRRGDSVLALADKGRDLVLLNGPELRSAGSGSITRTIHHELIHINLARAGVEQLPRWLEEGLAMRLSGERRLLSDWRVTADRAFGSVAAAEALWGPWGDNPDFQARAYRQSASLTAFFLNEYFPEGGAEECLGQLIRRRGPPMWVDDLWKPEIRYSLWTRWRNQGGRFGVWIQLLTAPSVLFVIVGVPLVIAAWLVKRRRARAIAEGWEAEGPYFGEGADDDPSNGP